ncbi:hypothetical protein TWF481_004986 [Arthrobotrys musiformis]|uniref:Uncharacterized protein n=1 Tax=Arthrobotrys musiformis TaxID=47236 RepID=A0AAV9WMA9_9PEZI
MSRIDRSSARCTCCRNGRCFVEYRVDRGGHCPHCSFGSNTWQPCPHEFCNGDCNGMCLPEGPHREPGLAWAENQVHRAQRRGGWQMTDFDNPDLTRSSDRNALAGADRRLRARDARLSGFYEGRPPLSPRGQAPVPRRDSPVEDFYGELGFSRDVPHSDPLNIEYPPGAAHHLSRGYNNLQDPNPSRYGASRAQPRNSLHWTSENYRPSVADLNRDPWATYDNYGVFGRHED